MQTTKIDSRRNRKPNRPITSKETESSNQKHFTQKKILSFNCTKPQPSHIFSMQQLDPDISNDTADQTHAIVYTMDIYL